MFLSDGWDGTKITKRLIAKTYDIMSKITKEQYEYICPGTD